MLDKHVTKLENTIQSTENHLRASLLALNDDFQEREKKW